MKDLNSITLEPSRTETVSAERFLEIYKNEKDNLETAKPVPSPLGSRELGRILVVRKRPTYTYNLENPE